MTGKVLYIASETPACPAERLALEAGQGAYARAGLQAFIVDAGCLHAK